MPAPDLSCAVCGFCYRLNDEKGECRRHPPILNEDHQTYEFPAVKLTSWCGEGRKKAAQKARKGVQA